MRTKILTGLYVGDRSDCRAVGEDWTVIHACKHHCYVNKVGQPSKDAPNYLSYQEGAHLYLNLIDPKLPLFQRKIFEDFLTFARNEWPSGRPMLIHCSLGKSRAPTLALLFLAKVLCKIRNTSFDDAWIDFELLTKQTYTPGEGIELWMREHWHELTGGKPLPSLNGAAEPVAGKQIKPASAKMPKTTEQWAALVTSQPLVHFSAATTIEDKEHHWISPDPNALQFDIDEAYTWCMDNNQPCRLIVLKPRQVGCSTKCAHTCYHHMRRFPSDMVVIGDKAERTKKVYGIFNDIAGHDGWATKWKSDYQFDTIKGKFTFTDGGEGVVEHDTALDAKAGISGTRQVVWLTEAARYRKTNNLDKKVVTAVLNSLADVPKSLAIAESTAEGASGWYYEQWQGAVTLEERKRGAIGNGWIKIFAAWFEFAEHSLPKTSANSGYFKEELDDRERRGILLYKWTAEQIAWRRMAIASKCAGDARMFDQDYPEDAQSCFLASGRPRFDMDRLVKMEAKAKIKHGQAQLGAVERSETGVSFVPKKDGDTWLWMIEPPTFGHKYLAFLDPCTGAQNEGSPFPDAHAAGIWRAGYMDGKEWVKPRLVACIDVPNGCRWEDNLLAQRLKDLADLYGGCMIVPETGNGLGALNALQHVGATIYQREKMDAMYPGQRLRIAGWETSGGTRPIVVNALATAIAEDAIEVEYLPAISEFKTFVINDRGIARSKQGCHDDQVMGLAIGLQCIDYAKPLLPPQRFKPLEEDGPPEGMDRALS